MFHSEKIWCFYNRIKYLKSLQSGIPFVFTQCHAKFIIDSDDSLPLEKKLGLDNILILVKTDFTKDENRYCHKMFLEKCFVSIS